MYRNSLFLFYFVFNSLLCSVKIHQSPSSCGTLCLFMPVKLRQSLRRRWPGANVLKWPNCERGRAYRNLVRDPLRTWKEFQPLLNFGLSGVQSWIITQGFLKNVNAMPWIFWESLNFTKFSQFFFQMPLFLRLCVLLWSSENMTTLGKAPPLAGLVFQAFTELA